MKEDLSKITLKEWFIRLIGIFFAINALIVILTSMLSFLIGFGNNHSFIFSIFAILVLFSCAITIPKTIHDQTVKFLTSVV